PKVEPISRERLVELDTLFKHIASKRPDTDTIRRYSHFDPNKLNDSLAARLGLSKRQSAMIQKYISKGGRFRKKEDFKKIYALTDADYKRLEPYIRIEEPDHRHRSKTDKYVNRPTQKAKSEKSQKMHLKPEIRININLADSIELLALPGIGPVF